MDKRRIGTNHGSRYSHSIVTAVLVVVASIMYGSTWARASTGCATLNGMIFTSDQSYENTGIQLRLFEVGDVITVTSISVVDNIHTFGIFNQTYNVDLGSQIFSSTSFSITITAPYGTTGGIFFGLLGPNTPPPSNVALVTCVSHTPTVAVTTATLPAAQVGAPYLGQALIASGGTSPYTFAANGLPNGLSLNASSGVISGTPTQAGNFIVNVTATDSTAASNGGPLTSASKSLWLAVAPASSTVMVTTSSLPSATFGSNYTAPALTASGGTSPYTFAATGLPNGLSLNASSGVISGTPTQAGTFTVNVTATDSTTPGQGGPISSPPKVLSFSVGQATQTITFTKPADVTFQSGLAVALSATASSGLPVTLASTTPTICTVNGATATIVAVGVCSITASQPGDANYSPAPSVTQTFNVIGAPKLTLAVAALPTTFARIGQNIALAYTVTNAGDAPVTSISVTDTRVNTIACVAGSVAVGATITCTGSTTTTAADLLARGITSTAFATGFFNAVAVNSTVVTTNVSIDADAIRGATKSAIQSFLGQRANMITSMTPDTSHLHDRLTGSLFDGSATGTPPAGLGGPFPVQAETQRPTVLRFAAAGLGVHDALAGDRNALLAESGSKNSVRVSPFAFNGATEDGMGRFAFSTSLAQMRAAAAAEQAQTQAASGELVGDYMRLSSGPRRSPVSAAPLAFDVWTQGAYSYYSNDRIDGKRQGHAGIVFAGADYVLMPGLLVGALVEFDWMDQTVPTILQRANGQGWMAGPYVSARLTQSLFFDARALWGRSNNDINPLGAYIDSFDTTRALAAAKLTGRWTFGAWGFQPSAEMTYFSEQQNAYVNAIGIAIDKQMIRLGRLTFGPEVSYRMGARGEATFEPFVGLKGVWDFAKSGETTAAGEAVGEGVWRGRLEAGANLKTSSGSSLRVQGSYDGIGDSQFHAWQGRATLIVPFQ